MIIFQKTKYIIIILLATENYYYYYLGNFVIMKIKIISSE